MRLYFAIMLSLLSMSPCMNAGTYISKVWVSDRGDGTYQNPIINADYSDPDVIAVGDDYWMTASSFCNTPGLPILHSRDLVNWEIVNYALPALKPYDFYDTPSHGKGVWAPSIRFHDGTYYIFWGDPDFGIFMTKTDNPRGEWSEPLLVKEAKGIIDTTPLWDEDGKAYLVFAWAASRAGMNSIVTVAEMSPDGTQLIGNPVLVFDGNDGMNHTVEGPKFYKRNGYYYILAPAGGVVNGWQLAMRSRSPFGPYESKIVMAEGKSGINGPHQGGWVSTPQGEDWFINFQDKGYMGRVLHLNPVKWVNDWPVIGVDKDGDGCGEPVKRHRKPKTSVKTVVMTPAESDNFDNDTLGLQWNWHANYRPEFGFTSRLGFMRVYGHKLSTDFVNFWEVPNLLTQKFPNDSFTATARLKVSAKSDRQQSGLIVMGWDYARLAVEKQGDDFIIKMIECHDAEQSNPEKSTTVATLPPTRKYEAGLNPNYEIDIYLRVKVSNGGLCRFSYSTDGRKWHECPGAFKARQGKWIGARIGIFSVQPHDTDRGWVDIDSFTIDK